MGRLRLSTGLGRGWIDGFTGTSGIPFFCVVGAFPKLPLQRVTSENED